MYKYALKLLGCCSYCRMFPYSPSLSLFINFLYDVMLMLESKVFVPEHNAMDTNGCATAKLN